MDAMEMVLLLDYYGSMLTEKQKECFDMRYNQDLSLGEIADTLGVSRQAVCDNLTRTEALLRRMEENIGCVKRDMKTRAAAQKILEVASTNARAIHLYEKLGFLPTREIKRWYRVL